RLRAQAGQRSGEIEVNAAAALANAAALIANFLGAARRDVARRQVPEARIFSLEIIVAFVFGNLLGRALVTGLFGNPDASVIAKRFRHERQFRLVRST